MINFQMLPGDRKRTASTQRFGCCENDNDEAATNGIPKMPRVDITGDGDKDHNIMDILNVNQGQINLLSDPTTVLIADNQMDTENSNRHTGNGDISEIVNMNNTGIIPNTTNETLTHDNTGELDPHLASPRTIKKVNPKRAKKVSKPNQISSKRQRKLRATKTSTATATQLDLLNNINTSIEDTFPGHVEIQPMPVANKRKAKSRLKTPANTTQVFRTEVGDINTPVNFLRQPTAKKTTRKKTKSRSTNIRPIQFQDTIQTQTGGQSAYQGLCQQQTLPIHLNHLQGQPSLSHYTNYQQILQDSSSEGEESEEESSSSDEDINDLGSQHIQLMNALPNEGINLNTSMFQYAEPISTAISQQLPHKIKKKIWKNQFIDLATLLPRTYANNTNTNFHLQLSSKAQISLVPNQTRKIYNIEMWTSAFLRFMAIYTERFPIEAPQLLKYAEIVRDLARRSTGLSWYLYDQQFRMLRETVQIPWGRLHTEFWVMALNTPTQRPFRNNFRQFRNTQQSSSNKGRKFHDFTCWTYNRRGFCGDRTCRFHHKCGLCKGSHPATNCTSQGRSTPQNAGSQNITKSNQPLSNTNTGRSNSSNTNTHTRT